MDQNNKTIIKQVIGMGFLLLLYLWLMVWVKITFPDFALST